MAVRETDVTPSNMWGGQGLLGVSIRFCSFEGTNENVWHVLVSDGGIKQSQSILIFKSYCTELQCLWTLRFQEVEPNSPAALAGLRAYDDYIIGADSVMNEVHCFAGGSWRWHIKKVAKWFKCFAVLLRVRICSPSSKAMKARSWSCTSTTQTQTTVARCSSLQTVTGVERAGNITVNQEISMFPHWLSLFQNEWVQTVSITGAIVVTNLAN